MEDPAGYYQNVRGVWGPRRIGGDLAVRPQKPQRGAGWRKHCELWALAKTSEGAGKLVRGNSAGRGGEPPTQKKGGGHKA